MPFNVTIGKATCVNIGTVDGLSSSMSDRQGGNNKKEKRKRRLWKAFWFPSPYSRRHTWLNLKPTRPFTSDFIMLCVRDKTVNPVSLKYDHEQVKPSNLRRSQRTRCRLACSVCLDAAPLSQLSIFWNRYCLALGASRYSC